MKRLVPLFLVLFSVTSMGQIPDYFGNNPKWHVGEWELDEFGLQQTEACISISGDSTIGSYTYKIFKFEYNCNPIPSPPLIGLYRQEGRNIYHYWFDTDSLYISYELTIGDTLDILQPNAKVDAIDSILVGTEYRRLFRIDTLNSEKMIIEGIGTRFGHFNCQGYWFELGYHDDGDHSWHGLELYTYVENGIALYGMDACSTVSLTENEPQKFKLYPVPANNTLTISSEDPLRSIEMLDLHGRIVLTQNVSNTESIMDISFLDSGVYFVRIAFQNDEVEVACLVKN